MTTTLYRLTDDEQKLLVSVMANYEDENPYFARTCQRILAELERGGKGEQDDGAAHALVKMKWLYPNYRVDSRGPVGCIMDALTRIAPDVAAELENEDAADVCDHDRDEVDLHSGHRRMPSTTITSVSPAFWK